MDQSIYANPNQDPDFLSKLRKKMMQGSQATTQQMAQNPVQQPWAAPITLPDTNIQQTNRSSINIGGGSPNPPDNQPQFTGGSQNPNNLSWPQMYYGGPENVGGPSNGYSVSSWYPTGYFPGGSSGSSGPEGYATSSVKSYNYWPYDWADFWIG